MKTVIVDFTIEMTPHPDAGKAHHFIMSLAGVSVDLALDIRTHTFTNVMPGVNEGFITVADSAGVELIPRFGFEAVVPEDAQMPIPVSVNITMV